jgi:hypothetical protein
MSEEESKKIAREFLRNSPTFGRMESILREISPHFEMVMAEPAEVNDIRLVHSNEHIM